LKAIAGHSEEHFAAALRALGEARAQQNKPAPGSLVRDFLHFETWSSVASQCASSWRQRACTGRVGRATKDTSKAWP
jgi:hypothetical protein